MATRAERLRKHRRAYLSAVVLVAGISFAQAFLVLSPRAHIESDMRGYVERAMALVSGVAPSRFDHFYPPGTSLAYAAVMGLFGPRLIALNIIAILQVASLIVSAAAAGRTARILWRSPRAEILTLILVAAFWPLAALGSFFLSEPIFCALYFTAQLYAVEALLRPRKPRLYLSGMLYGFSALVRTQGLLGLLGTGVWLVCARRRRKDVAQLFLGAAAPLLFLVLFNLIRYDVFSLSVATNDAFNIYLGQSRHAAVSCINPSDGTYYIFHNNNASDFISFLPLEFLSCDITDRGFFLTRTLELWRESPARQLSVSAANLFELFSVRPGWPLVAYEPKFASIDRYFQLFGLALLALPAALVLSGVCVIPFTNAFAIRTLLGTPLMLFFATIALSTGQPRYLLPQYYTFIPLASGFWLLVVARRVRFAPRNSALALVVVPVLLLLHSASFRELERASKVTVAKHPYALSGIRPALDAKARFWWFELPYGGTPNFISPADGITVFTDDFPLTRADQSLSREVRVRALIRKGEFNPKTHRLRAALYLREEPYGWGSCLVKVRENGVERGFPLSEIRGSRWFSVPLGGGSTPQNVERLQAQTETRTDAGTGNGTVEVSFTYQKLTGDYLQLDAVVLYTESISS